MSLFFEEDYVPKDRPKYLGPKFRDEAHKNAFLKTIKELKDAVKAAGGNLDGVAFSQMTIEELLLLICTNNIGFSYSKPPSVPKTEPKYWYEWGALGESYLKTK